MKPTKLSDPDIEARLQNFPNWMLNKGQIVREFQFDNFAQVLPFFKRVTEIAQALNHHPDFFNSYTSCRIALNTHDVNGISDLDFLFAERLDALLESQTAS
jgi:4a-hydroxytetrahydrobiopterin dehydratase